MRRVLDTPMKYLANQKMNKFMKRALKEAKKAYKKGEVPIGAVVVKDNKIIAKAYNQRETKQDPTGHAEIIALKKASKKIKSWRLEDCDIYVTLEPCPMCAGAIIQARIKNLYFGAYDFKSGAASSAINLFNYPWNHQVKVKGGILESESKELLQTFFKSLRK